MKKMILVILSLLFVAGTASSVTGIKKKRPLPPDYGQVIMNNSSEKARIAPVVFDHWLHRMRYSCRVCHVDIAFMMKAGATNVTAADNAKGYYCGACHNGKMTVDGKKLFAACPNNAASADADQKDCKRCHSFGVKNAGKEYDFARITKAFPRQRFGNGIDWEKIELDGTITIADFVEGVSIKRKPLEVKKDFDIKSKEAGMPDIIFSHAKHIAWNGCELCHPEIFLGVKKGMTKYSMPEIYEGKYCGVCHGSVAFPLMDCQRCHTKPVQ